MLILAAAKHRLFLLLMASYTRKKQEGLLREMSKRTALHIAPNVTTFQYPVS